MKVLKILLLINMGMVECLELIPTPSPNDNHYEDALEWFPWSAVITNEKLTYYGTIVHERAVLTLAVLEIGKLYSDFQVQFDFYRYGDYPRFKDLPYRNIQEYNIIKSERYNYQQSFAILIVDKPFPPVQPHSINPRVIPLVENQTDLDYGTCVTLSVRSYEKDSTTNVTIVNSIGGVFDNNEFFITIDDGHTIYDDHGIAEYLIIDGNPGVVMDINGGPVVCRSKQPPHHWIQDSVLHVILFERDNSISLQLTSHWPLINIPIKNIVEKILYRARVA